MSIQQFHETANQLIDTINAFIEANIEQTGNASWECPQTAAKNALLELSACFNGTGETDLSTPDADHQRVFLELDRATAEALIETVNIATESPRLSDAVVERAQQATTNITDGLVG